MALSNQILKDALALTPVEQAELVDRLLSNLDRPLREIDERWAEEAESRIDAFEKGKLKAVPLEQVLEKYK